MTGTGEPADRAADHGVRVDLGTVLAGLRHLDPSGEPARVFTGLAQVCVPALADECVIWISEQGQHPYRIRRAAPAVPAGAAAVLDGMLSTAPDIGTTVLTGSPAGAASVEIGDHAVTARFVNPPWLGGPDYRGVLICRWHSDHHPDHTEAALVGVMVDHATALVQHHRIADTEPADPPPPVGSGLPGPQRIAAASGILMALYHLSPAQARHLLGRASENTHRPITEIADTVLRTGGLPAPHSGDPRPTRPDPNPTDPPPLTSTSRPSSVGDQPLSW